MFRYYSIYKPSTLLEPVVYNMGRATGFVAIKKSFNSKSIIYSLSQRPYL